MCQTTAEICAAHNEENGRWEERALRIHGLMNVFQGRQQYSGSWDEYLDCCIEVFETIVNMSAVTEQQVLTALPVMITGDALTYYSNGMNTCTSYGEAIQSLKNCYISDEKKTRILTACQSILLSKSMAESQRDSEVTR